jgi:hypothetical protein
MVSRTESKTKQFKMPTRGRAGQKSLSGQGGDPVAGRGAGGQKGAGHAAGSQDAVKDTAKDELLASQKELLTEKDASKKELLTEKDASKKELLADITKIRVHDRVAY